MENGRAREFLEILIMEFFVITRIESFRESSCAGPRPLGIQYASDGGAMLLGQSRAILSFIEYAASFRYLFYSGKQLPNSAGIKF